MATILAQKLAQAQEANDAVRNFMRRFEVGKLLSVCRASKSKGFSVVELFRFLLCCMFSQTSMYMSMRVGSFKESFSKNTIYRFCSDARINWHKFVRLLSAKVVSEFFRPATSDKRLEYFIFDDTPFAKSGKKTELVAKFFNHVSMKYERGFRILTLLWSDEYSSVPVDFCPLSSGKDELLTCPAKRCDGRSLAGKIRRQARQKAPEIMMDMLKSAMKAGHKANYVLFDSWFATPKGITDIKEKTGLDVLAMLKKSGKVFYEYGDQQLDLKRIYALNRKRPGRAKYLLSVEANLIQKEKGQIVSRLPVRIVFVRNRNKRKDWIALISTDMEISEEEIIRRYGVRWNIEVYFKTCKQQLKLLKECGSPSFDAFTCHLAIVCVRYMILSVVQRANTDDRTLGELFCLMTAEVAEVSYNATLSLILEALLDAVRETFAVSDEQMETFTKAFISRLPDYLRASFGVSDTFQAA